MSPRTWDLVIGPAVAVGGFPDASNTGVPPGTVLTTAETDYLDVDGQTIEDKIFPSGINVRAQNITLRRCLVQGRIDTTYGFQFIGHLFEDCTIDGSGDSNWWGQAAIGNDGYTALRCDISGFRSGPWVAGMCRVEDSFIHDMIVADPESHQSGCPIEGGSNNIIRHNTIICDTDNCSNAAGLYNESWSNSGGYDNQIIEYNFFKGGAHTFYGGTPEGALYPGPTNAKVRYNTWYRGPDWPNGGAFGPLAFWAFNTGNEWHDNVWSDDNSEVPAVNF